MSNENITYLGIGRIRDHVLLASVFDRISAAEKTEIESSMAQFLGGPASRFGPGTREKRQFGQAPNTMFLLADKQRICLYAVSVRGRTYPDRVAFAMLDDAIRMTHEYTNQDFIDSVDPGHGRLTKPLRKPFKELMDKYDKPENIDKAAEVHGKVENVKLTMQDNIKKVLETHENIDRLESKTDNLNREAAQFNRSANDLRRMYWWQKVKVTILLAIVIAAILAYLILVIVSQVS